MRNKRIMRRAALLCAVLCALMLMLSLTSCGKSSSKVDAGDDAKRPDLRYTNPSTKYTVRIIDEEDQISGVLEDSLEKTMTLCTDYCDVIYWSCSESKDSVMERAEEWQTQGIRERDSILFVSDIQTGQYYVFPAGKMISRIPNGRRQEILDEAYDEASGDEYTFANTYFGLIYSELSGKPVPSSDASVVYTNPDTGYEVRILDDLDLLSDEEESMLAEDMKPITEYGHIMFWSTGEYASNAKNQAKAKRYSFYGYESAGILVINMNNRYVTFHSDGDIEKYVGASKARSITDNVSHYASEKKYYTCAKEAYEQVYKVIQGRKIPEPMKYISAIVIAMMIAFIVVVGIVFGKRFNPLYREDRDQAKLVGEGALMTDQPTIKKTATNLREWVEWVLMGIMFILEVAFSGDSSGSGGSSSGGSSSGGGSGGSSRF